jgi:mRNA interferase RelE/StbE
VSPWERVWSPPALRDLRRLDRTVATRVLEALRILAEERRGDVRRLQGQEARWRLRVGDWRVIFTYDADAHAIVILSVKPRGEAYRG